MKRTLCALLAAATLAATVPPAGASVHFPGRRTYNGQFTDVLQGSWYANTVALCYELGLFSGKSDTIFDPAGEVTYAEAAALTARVHEIYAGGDGVFAQGDAWWSGAAAYLAQTGILRDQLGQADYYDNLPAELEEHYISYSGGAMGETIPYDEGPWANQPIGRLRAAAWLGCALPDSELTAINTVGTLPGEPTAPSEEETAQWAKVKQLYRAGVRFVLLPTSQGLNASALFDRQGNQVSPVLYMANSYLENQPQIDNGFLLVGNELYDLR